jgi:hypothetical protein
VRIAEPHGLMPEPTHRRFEQLDRRLALVLRIEIGGRTGPRRVCPEQIEHESEAKTAHAAAYPLRWTS